MSWFPRPNGGGPQDPLRGSFLASCGAIEQRSEPTGQPAARKSVNPSASMPASMSVGPPVGPPASQTACRPRQPALPAGPASRPASKCQLGFEKGESNLSISEHQDEEVVGSSPVSPRVETKNKMCSHEKPPRLGLEVLLLGLVLRGPELTGQSLL